MHYPFDKLLARREDTASDNLARQNAEPDLDLVEPAGMNRGMDQESIRPTGADTLYRLLTTMSGAVIHNPKDALGGFVGFLTHDLSEEALGWGNAAFLLTAAEELSVVDVPSRQIAPSAMAKIFVFDAHRAARSRWQGGLLTPSGLNAGFLICRDHEFRTMEGFALPEPGIEIEDAPGLASEIRIAGKNPTPMLPGTKGVGTEPTPQGRATDLGDDPLGHHLLADIGEREPRQRQPAAMGKFTCEGFYLHHDAGGKRTRDARPEAAPRGPGTGPVQIVCATCSQSDALCPIVPRCYRWSGLVPPGARF